MKRTIVLIAIITIALIVTIPVMAQTDPGSGYPIPTEESTPFPVDSGYPIETPYPVCCYDVEDNKAVCDEYYEQHLKELCEDCSDRCEQPKPAHMIIVWFQKFIKLIYSVFE